MPGLGFDLEVMPAEIVPPKRVTTDGTRQEAVRRLIAIHFLDTITSTAGFETLRRSGC